VSSSNEQQNGSLAKQGPAVKAEPSPEAAAPAEGPAPASLRRSAGLVSALTFLSRVLGLVREQVFAALLGAGVYADAFQAAFKIPNLLRDLFAEGALSSAFVPTYVRALRTGGREAAFQLASRLMSLLAVVLAVLVVVAWLFAPQIVTLLAPGFEHVPGKREATILLTRVMLPFLPLVSFAAVAMGMLNAHGRFGTPAFAPAAFNVVAVAWAAGLWSLGFDRASVALGWAVGTLLGGAAQFLIQVPGLRRLGWRLRPQWRPGDPNIRAIARLMGPATIGLAAVEVNIFVNTIFASHQPGAVSWLQYAFRVLYLPIGIFGVAVGTVVTSHFARGAAAEDVAGMRGTLHESLRLLAFLTLPSTAGLVLLSQPIVRLLFERGRFDPADTLATAAALACFAVGLVPYTSVKVLAPAFYALGTPRVPLVASASAVLVNLVFILAFHPVLGHRAIALGTALGSLSNGLVLLLVLERRLGGVLRGVLTSSVARMVAATAAMAPVLWLSARWLERTAGTQGLLAQAVTGLGPIALGGLTYAGAALALRIPEARALWGGLRRRLRRRG
jgi:putative peptidoglycan lipid II flippase